MSESSLRQQIAEAIHKSSQAFEDAVEAGLPLAGEDYDLLERLSMADAVVALLNLTEELGQRYSEAGSAAGDVVLPGVDLNFPGGYVVHRYCTPWLPSTPPDTSSSEPA